MRQTPQRVKSMTLKELTLRFTAAGIPDARYDARALFKYFAHASDADLSDPRFDSDCEELIRAAERRESREPLQYIIGEVGFYRETYKVSSACLIPRADTELLVDYAVKNIPSGKRFADLCCGSGCIGISTLKNTVGTSALLVDISEEALGITRENARLCGVLERADIVRLDLMSETPCGTFYAVLSNPPYVTDEEYESLEPEIYKEPKCAFVGGHDGADFYRTLTPIYKEKLEDGGFIAYEIGYRQAELISKIAEDNGMSCEILRDYSDNPRVAVLRRIDTN